VVVTPVVPVTQEAEGWKILEPRSSRKREEGGKSPTCNLMK
jgi:hypothetical protein